MDPFAKDKVVRLESTQAIQRSVESIKFGEDLMFALELADDFRAEVDNYAISLEQHRRNPKSHLPEKPTPSIHFLGRPVYDHVLLKLKAIRSADLENTMKFLNYKQSASLLFYAEHYLR